MVLSLCQIFNGRYVSPVIWVVMPLDPRILNVSGKGRCSALGAVFDSTSNWSEMDRTKL